MKAAPRSCETPRHSPFWESYHGLPTEVQRLADQCYERLKQDPHHPSLRFREVGRFWSARVGLHYRALAIEDGQDYVWFWIGSHAEYDRLLDRQ